MAERAEQAHAWATSHGPTYWLIWRASGATALLQGDYGAAAEGFRRAAALYDRDWTTWSGLGDAAAAMGDTQQAADAYRRALRLAPGQPEVQRALDRLLQPTATAPQFPPSRPADHD